MKKTETLNFFQCHSWKSLINYIRRRKKIKLIFLLKIRLACLTNTLYLYSILILMHKIVNIN